MDKLPPDHDMPLPASTMPIPVDAKRQARSLYFQAVLRGAYRPRLAVIILLQIILSDTGYRRLADRAISWLRAGYRASPKPGVAS